MAGAINRILSLVAYYGTLLAMAGLGALGVSLALNNAIWAGVKSFSCGSLCQVSGSEGATMDCSGRSCSLRSVRRLITFAMLVAYGRLIELAGFALLCVGAYCNSRS